PTPSRRSPDRGRRPGRARTPRTTARASARRRTGTGPRPPPCHLGRGGRWVGTRAGRRVRSDAAWRSSPLSGSRVFVVNAPRKGSTTQSANLVRRRRVAPEVPRLAAALQHNALMAGHGEDHAAARTPLRVRRLLAAALVPFVLATAVGLIVLWPAHQRHRAARTLGTPAQLVNGTVASVDTHPCPAGGGRCSTVFVRVTG